MAKYIDSGEYMKKLITSPKADGFHMPGEFEKHIGTIMIWPVRPGSWPYGGIEAQKIFTQIAKEIAKHEVMYMLADKEHAKDAAKSLDADIIDVQNGETVPDTSFKEGSSNIHVLVIPTDDSWARDVGPTFVTNKRGSIRGIDWKFNAWGGDIDGLYPDYENDNAAASKICKALDTDVYDAQDFVLEGGAIHSDGEGTVIVTESCLLSKGRNPKMSKAKITDKLCSMLGAKKVIWIPYGIYNDETNEHVDNVCAFTKPGEVVLAWTDDTDDPQYKMSAADLQVLISTKDAKGRKLKVHKLLIPKKPVCIKEEELEGYEFAEGEDTRQVGERLAASYVNFYICNEAVIVPQFGDVNDKAAIKKLKALFPDREVIGIPARQIIVGGGNIHCITQQIPAN
jgi:agmatine deiminase